MGISIEGGISIEEGISIYKEVEIPENTVAPVASGNFIARGTVTSTTGTWATIQAPTYTYQWQQNFANIVGATSNAYVINVAYVGSNLQCVVKATNSYGNSTANSNSQIITANVPLAPIIGTATRANATSVNVAFTASSSNGGSAITSYTATSTPSGLTATGTTSPLTVTGLTTGTPYTFRVTATNSIGTSAASAASNSIAPSPNVGDSFRGGYFLSDNGATYSVLGPAANRVGPAAGNVVISSYFLQNINGYTDWGAGTLNNWTAAYNNKATFDAIGEGFGNLIYWTGVEVFPYTSNMMWYQNMTTGAQGIAFKYTSPLYYGRPFRNAAW
jgi:hypothetical protein